MPWHHNKWSCSDNAGVGSAELRHRYLLLSESFDICISSIWAGVTITIALPLSAKLIKIDFCLTALANQCHPSASNLFRLRGVLLGSKSSAKSANRELILLIDLSFVSQFAVTVFLRRMGGTSATSFAFPYSRRQVNLLTVFDASRRYWRLLKSGVGMKPGP